ncbi:M20/M25/M40 family metallo-hydrolase [Duganella sp. HSC-15S17]|nr:M20/M25/M40 family metallo-hydrolase [Duganella violaceicalia]
MLERLLIAALVACCRLAHAQLPAEHQQMRDIFQQLVEIDTTDSAGSCTDAAQAMALRLKAGGYGASELQLIVPPGGPRKGNLVATLKGDGTRRPLLLLAHLDVVEAKRADWTRDPFKLIEENGTFYGRGVIDDKAMAAALVVTMLRLKREQVPLRRNVILALTCDEELARLDFRGVDYLLKHHRPLIDAELAINEGAYGMLDAHGKRVALGVQIGEKATQSYDLDVVNAGGHSSLPVDDNAIYHLADGLSRLARWQFPLHLLPSTRAYFEQLSQLESGPLAADMQATLRQPPDADAAMRLAQADPNYHAMLRTTCVATQVDAGHAANALPQRAHAVVNCRILPGESQEEVQQTLARVLDNPKIKLTPIGMALVAPTPPINPQLMQAIAAVAAELWPGTPLLPTLFVAGSDGRFLNSAGIWTYGVTGIFVGADRGNMHGLNESVPVKSVYEGQQFLYRLARKLAAE